MKNFFITTYVLFLIACFSIPALGANKEDCDLTGYEWEQSSQHEKLAFLYGVSSVIVIEDQLAQKKRKPPSLFVQSWMKVFKHESWVKIQRKIDDWYKENPEQKDITVLSVLWYEYIVPTLKQ